MGSAAEKFVFADNAGFDWHFSGRGDLVWNRGPQPSSRAAAVLDLAGVDWRQTKRGLGLDHADTGDRPPLPANWPQVDGELRQAFDDLVATDLALSSLHKAFGDDADSRDEYMKFEERRDDIIATLIGVPALSMAGVQAKASALRHKVMIEDFDRHQQIAVSLADDLIALGPAGITEPNVAAADGELIALGERVRAASETIFRRAHEMGTGGKQGAPGSRSKISNGAR
jgi:hypothetical protein